MDKAGLNELLAWIDRNMEVNTSNVILYQRLRWLKGHLTDLDTLDGGTVPTPVSKFADTISRHFLRGLQDVHLRLSEIEKKLPSKVYGQGEEQFTPFDLRTPSRIGEEPRSWTPRKSLADLQREAHDTAKEKGWWDAPRGIPECLALIHSEVSEALEDFRDGNMLQVVLGNGKPTGFPSELADIVIRVMDLAGHLEISLQEAVEIKMAYNATRPHRHGGKIA